MQHWQKFYLDKRRFWLEGRYRLEAVFHHLLVYIQSLLANPHLKPAFPKQTIHFEPS